MNEITIAVASRLHDDWRASRRLADGSYEPRWKDENTVDIANTAFVDLPAKWQAENLAAAEHALEAVATTSVLEDAAAAIHDGWLAHNGQWAPAEQAVQYTELTEGEKEKDRVVARSAAHALGITLL